MTFFESTISARTITLRVCVSVGLAVFLLLLSPALFGFFHYGLDLTRIDLGILCAIDRQLEQGESLWLSSYLGNGGPLFARPSARLLYPPQYLAILMSPDWGVSFFASLHVGIAAGAATYLARVHGCRPGASLIAGVVFACTGTVLDLVLHGTFVVAAAWLPLVWATSRRVLQPRGKPLHAGLLGAALLGLLLGGEPQAYAIGCCLITVELARVIIKHRVFPGRGALQLGLVIVGAFALAMPMWVQTLTEMILSRRGEALGQAEALWWSFGPSSWLAALWPGVLDEFARPLTHYWSVWQGNENIALPWNRQPYMGPLFFVAALCGIGLWRARTAALVMVVGVVFSLGDTLPVLPLLMKAMPLLAWFRYPAKYLVVTTLAAVVVVILSLREVDRDPVYRRRFVVAGLTYLSVHLLALILLALFGGVLDRTAMAAADPHPELDLPNLSKVLIRSAIQAAIPLAMAVAMSLWWPTGRRYLLALVALDLFLAVPSSVSVGPSLSDLETPLAALSTLQPADSPVLCSDPRLRTRSLHAVELAVSDWGRLVGVRAVVPPELQACDGLRGPVTYGPLQTAMNERLDEELGDSSVAAARALGCTHLLASRTPTHGTAYRVSAPSEELKRYQKLLRVRLYEIPDSVSEVFLSSGPRLFPDEDSAWQAIRSSHTAAALSSVIDDPADRLASGSILSSNENAVVAIEWDGPDRALLRVQGIGPAVVGVRTAFQMGWRAVQAGNELPVVRVGGQHLGVVLQEAETGHVEIYYQPPYFRLSLLAAACGFLAIVAACLLAKNNHGPNPQTPHHSSKSSPR